MSGKKKQYCASLLYYFARHLATFFLVFAQKMQVFKDLGLSHPTNADSDNWHLDLLEKAMARSYHLLDYD